MKCKRYYYYIPLILFFVFIFFFALYGVTEHLGNIFWAALSGYTAYGFSVMVYREYKQEKSRK